MAHSDDTARKETLARMAQSRAEIRRVLEPPPPPEPNADGTIPSSPNFGFPRSRTMKLLTSGRGVGTVGAVVGGLLLARPALALRLIRAIPTGAVARMLVVKAITAIRSRQQ